MRNAATKALDAAGISWRLAFVSPSLGGLWAATAAGLGITLRTPVGLPAKVRPLMAEELALPELQGLGLVLHRAEAESAPAVARLAGLVRQSVSDMLGEVARPVGGGVRMVR